MSAVIVCGGREYGDYEELEELLERYLEPGDVVWHGGARGADTLAGRAAEALGHDVVVVSAQWNRHGKAAGPIRNQRMLELANPRMLIALPGGRGTTDMVKRAIDADGVRVLVPRGGVGP